MFLNIDLNLVAGLLGLVVIIVALFLKLIKATAFLSFVLLALKLYLNHPNWQIALTAILVGMTVGFMLRGWHDKQNAPKPRYGDYQDHPTTR